MSIFSMCACKVFPGCLKVKALREKKKDFIFLVKNKSMTKLKSFKMRSVVRSIYMGVFGGKKAK